MSFYWNFFSIHWQLILNFSADRVFRGDNTTKEVYQQGAKEIALSVVNGINCKCIQGYISFNEIHT